jgi:hypothetical protein
MFEKSCSACRFVSAFLPLPDDVDGAVNILVETAHVKKPKSAELGTDEAVLTAGNNGESTRHSHRHKRPH